MLQTIFNKYTDEQIVDKITEIEENIYEGKGCVGDSIYDICLVLYAKLNMSVDDFNDREKLFKFIKEIRKKYKEG